MMIRPVDQARLLFLYLLRGTTAAMATVRSTEGTIALRLARKSDISLIQKCNLATLPENYSYHFYKHHIETWPDLSIVAERIVETNNSNNGWGSKKSIYNNNNGLLNQYYNSDDYTKEGNEIIGYVIGKVDEKFVNINTNNNVNNNNNNVSQKKRKTFFDKQEVKLPRSVVTEDDEESLSTILFQSSQRQQQRSTMLGHVTSLAVLKPYRRCGVAAELMKQLHCHFEECYPTTEGVNLHVRVSNIAACKLYQQTMGYQIDQIIPGYYQDGEDAYFMRKPMFLQQQQQQHRHDDTTTKKRPNTFFNNNDSNSNPNQVSLYTSSTAYEPSRISQMKRAFGKLTLRGGNSKNQIANWIPFTNTDTNNNKVPTSIKSSTEIGSSTDFQLPRYLTNKQNDASVNEVNTDNTNINKNALQLDTDTNNNLVLESTNDDSVENNTNQDGSSDNVAIKNKNIIQQVVRRDDDEEEQNNNSAQVSVSSC